MQQIAIENLFLLDIETVSGVSNFNLLNDEWKELWTEKILKSLPPDTTAEEYYPKRAAILAEFAKVICISTGYFKKENNDPMAIGWQLRIKSFYSENEKDVLESFTKMLEQLHAKNSRWIFTGHNIKEFDIPFLSRRMLVNNIEIPSYIDFQNMKPWDTPVLDTLHLWRFGDYKHYTSLKLLAATLGVPSPKDDIDGSKVGEVFWEEKDLERIAIYCQKDVATVANVILRFKGLPLLNEQQIVFR
ncbi:MAG TPA: ribonuclease H-like domain-containing protein [Ginsengibacter sp.]